MTETQVDEPEDTDETPAEDEEAPLVTTDEPPAEDKPVEPKVEDDEEQP